MTAQEIRQAIFFVYLGFGCGVFAGALLFFPAFRASYKAAGIIDKLWGFFIVGFLWPFVLWAECDDRISKSKRQ